jgi:isoleucyl-tRNA synthetase
MYDFKKVENEMHDFWSKSKIYEKLMERKGKKYFLLDGPPYANNIPHVGHIKNTVFKDLILRMAFMKGNKVLFQPGFDTHGLPIENMVEKKLNLGGKKEIEKFGIDKFMQECKNNAALNKDIWMKVYKELGSMYALKEPYLTYEDYYIEGAWWAFSQMHKKGLVYEGEKPVMWCPHCETSLAGYEVTDSYKNVTDPGVYVLFKLKDEDSYLLVFTTTPWTLPANVAVAVAPNEDYVKADINGRNVILGEKRLQKLSGMGFGYSIIEKFKGKKLVGKEYEPLLNVPLQEKLKSGKFGKAHVIIASIPLLKERVSSKVRAKKEVQGKDIFEEFVTMTEGTGMVHTAPGHGKTDYLVGQHYKLACVSPLDDACYFKDEAGFSGFVKSADPKIIERLEQEGKLLFKESITHSYPLCWRCKSPLIFRLSKQLFLKVDKVKKVSLKENEKVDWMPEFARERFTNWVENAEDWNISRQRYWGIPIPLWKCECGKEKVIENKKELENLSGTKIKDIHTAGEVKIKCSCGKQMEKFKGILDVWFDSGVAPWASLGYPLQNKELFEDHFPVDRINEAQDQIRGWFYSLMFCSAAVFEKAPYKAVSMTGWVVDKRGEKMSKSLGNVVTGEDALKELGADALRYYFCWDISPYEIQKFNMENAKKEVGGILNIFWNLQNLTSNEKIKELDIEDKWIISKLNSLIKKYNELVERFELNTAMKLVSDFISNSLSRGYVQMTREKDNSAVITYCMKNLLQILAPVCPFITEKIWQNLKEDGVVKEESIHLSEWPKADEKKINKKLEEEFEKIFEIIEKGLAERDKLKIGLKWPLVKVVIYSKEKINKETEEIIARQLNVKSVVFTEGEELKVEFDTAITPELEAEGYAREVSRGVQAERKKKGLVKEDKILLKISGKKEILGRLESQKGIIMERTNAKNIVFSTEKLNGAMLKIKDYNIEVLFNKI